MTPIRLAPPYASSPCHGFQRGLILLLGVLAGLFSAKTRSEPPAIVRIAPLFVPRDSPSELSLIISNPGNDLHVWSSAGNARLLDSAPSNEVVRVLLTPSPNFAPGLILFQVFNTNGASPWKWIATDDLDSPASPSNHHSAAKAFPLAVPSAIDRAFSERESDWYLIPGPTAEPVTIEVLARRLLSAADPFVRFFDRDGRRLDSLEDTPGLEGDLKIRRPIPPGGLWMELRDSSFGGGQDFRYRLRLARSGWPGNGHLLGSFPPDLAGSLARTAAEFEPNDSPTNATTAGSVPVTLSGTFQKPGDTDFFRLPSIAVTGLLAIGRSRSLGSEADLRLRLFDASGRLAQESNVSGPDDGQLSAQVKAGEDYLLAVDELSGGSGPAFRYEVHLMEGLPITATLASNTVSASPGSVVELTVQIQAPQAPATLRPVLESSSWRIEPAEIALPSKEVTVKIFVPSSLAAGEVHWLRPTFVASWDGHSQRVPLSTLPALRKHWPDLVRPPMVLDGLVEVIALPR